MENLNLGTPTNINGLLFGEEGKITAFSLCSTSLMEVICHGKSDHYVTFQGGFHAGKGSYSNLGIALGKNAIVTDGDGIQLGSGTNSDPNTLQVYDFKLLDDEGKIPQDRLPNLTIELAVIGNDLSWRYVGETTWIPILDITNLQGVDGQSFEVNEYGILNEAKIAEINNNVTTGRYLFLVNPLGDIRVDNTTPATLNGDMSRHILMYDGDEQLWFDYGEFTGLQGEPGTPVELQNNGTYIQWKYTTSPTWNNIITLTDLKGDKGDTGDSGLDGKNIELDGTDVNYIRWRNVGDTTWINLINKSTITGPKGASGDDGRDVEFRVYSNRWLQWRYVGEIAWNNSYDLNLLSIVDNKWEDVAPISPETVVTQIQPKNGLHIDASVVDNLPTSKGDLYAINVANAFGDWLATDLAINADEDYKWTIYNLLEPRNNIYISDDSIVVKSNNGVELIAPIVSLASSELYIESSDPNLPIDYVPTNDNHIVNKKYVDDKELRNFSTNPIDLESEITGVLPISNIAEGFLKLDQTPRQTLNTSPSFEDLIAGSLLIVGENKELKVLDGMTWDATLARLKFGEFTPKSALYDPNIGILTNNPKIAGLDYVNTNPLGNVRFMSRNDTGEMFIMDLSGSQNTGSVGGMLTKDYASLFLSGGLASTKKLLLGTTRNTDTVVMTNNSIWLYFKNNQRLGVGIENPTEKLDVNGNIKASGGVQIGDRQTTASADLKGTTRYREGSGYSVTEMCMQISDTEYAWKEIVRNEW